MLQPHSTLAGLPNSLGWSYRCASLIKSCSQVGGPILYLQCFEGRKKVTKKDKKSVKMIKVDVGSQIEGKRMVKGVGGR